MKKLLTIALIEELIPLFLDFTTTAALFLTSFLFLIFHIFVPICYVTTYRIICKWFYFTNPMHCVLDWYEPIN